MQYFNIDELVPDYSPRFATPKRRLTARDKQMIERSRRIFTAHPYNRPADSYPGVKPETLLDWRGIERRKSEIWQMWQIANGTLWDALKRLHKSRKLAKGDSLYVFTDPEWVLEYTERGISHHDPASLAKDWVEGTYNKKKMSVIKYEEGGSEIGRMEHKANRLLRMHGVYERILSRAISDRLQIHLDRIRDEYATKYETHYYPSTVYLIENGGRVMVARSDSMGRISWIDGEVMFSKAEGEDHEEAAA